MKTLASGVCHAVIQNVYGRQSFQEIERLGSRIEQNLIALIYFRYRHRNNWLLEILVNWNDLWS
jgi:hypothetical protein